MANYILTVLRGDARSEIPASAEESLLSALRAAGYTEPDAPCGGNGTCGKCKVIVDGQEVLACKTAVDRDMTVTLSHQKEMKILLSAGEGESGPEQKMLRTVIEFRWSADVGQVMFYALCR